MDLQVWLFSVSGVMGGGLRQSILSTFLQTKKHGRMRCLAQIFSMLFRRQRSESVSLSADLGLRCTRWAFVNCSSQQLISSWDYSVLRGTFVYLVWGGCMTANVWRSEGQPVETASPLSSRGAWRLNSGPQARQQASVSTEPSCLPHCACFNVIWFRLFS